MAGVARPMLRRVPLEGLRFLLGLATGAIVAGLVLGLAALVLGQAFEQVMPTAARAVLVAGGLMLLGIADIADRTPHVWRQVPQALVRRLSPGFLGLSWGIDIGLLFSTQKAVSLVWGAAFGVVLLHPTAAPVLFVVVAVVSSTSIILLTAHEQNAVLRHGTKADRRWLRTMRVASGSVLLMAFAYLVVVSCLI